MFCIPAFAEDTRIYSYNGVELPLLPEWDKETYPHAYIYEKSGVIRFRVFSDVLFRDGFTGDVDTAPMKYGTYDGTAQAYVHLEVGTMLLFGTCTLSDNAWGSLSSGSYVASSSVQHRSFGNVLWTNTDVPNLDDGTTYLAASDPVYVSGYLVSSVSVSPSSGTVSSGSTCQFYQTVAGEGSYSQAVTWGVSGNTSSATSINGVGLLTVGADETASTLTVTATSVDDPSVSGSATVSVYVPPSDYVTGLSISPVVPTMHPGESLTFTATVSGEGSFDNSLSWVIYGNDSANTYIDSNGTLTVAEDETSTAITVEVCSVSDPDIKASASVTVEHYYITDIEVTPQNPVITYDGTTQQLQFHATTFGVGDYDPSVEWWCIPEKGTASMTSDGVLAVTLSEEDLASDIDVFRVVVGASAVSDGTVRGGTTCYVQVDISADCACLSILDYLMTAFEFYPFDPNTGALSTTPEEINGLVPAFYRFMQSMEEKLGALSMNVTPSKQEQALREETAEIADTAIEEFYSEDSEIKVTGKDISVLSKLLKRLTKILDTGVGVDSLFDLFDDESNLSWFSQEVANDLNTVGSFASVHSNDNYDASPDEHEQYNMHYYDEKIEQIEVFANGGE